MCYITLETNHHLVGESDHYPQHPQHPQYHHLLQDGQSTKGDMFLEFLVHTDENVNVYSWEKVNEDNWQLIDGCLHLCQSCFITIFKALVWRMIQVKSFEYLQLLHKFTFTKNCLAVISTFSALIEFLCDTSCRTCIPLTWICLLSLFWEWFSSHWIEPLFQEQDSC